MKEINNNQNVLRSLGEGELQPYQKELLERVKDKRTSRMVILPQRRLVYHCGITKFLDDQK